MKAMSLGDISDHTNAEKLFAQWRRKKVRAVMPGTEGAQDAARKDVRT